MRNLRNLACALLTIFATVSLSAQQISGSIRGAVSDSSGALIQGASVTAKQSETGFTRTATTDRDGNYLLLELPVGHYQLEATAKGFQ